MTGSDMMNHIQKILNSEKNECVFKNDVEILTYLFDNCEIEFPKENRFFGRVNFATIAIQVYMTRAKRVAVELDSSEYFKGHVAGAYSGTFDFSHTTPEWDTLLETGFVGIINRINEYEEKNPDKKDFYTSLKAVWNSILSFLKRASEKAKAVGKEEIALGLDTLTKRAPETLFEAMQLTIVYYILQHIFEGTFLRTLGRLDTLFYPFYLKETEENTKALLLDYLAEIDTLNAPANIPFALGGSDAHGNCLVNPLSYLFLDAYRKAGTTNTKFHLLCTDNMPSDIIRLTLDAVREGNNSVVFLSDKTCIKCLENHGADRLDAIDYHVVGCYEVGARGELASTTNGRVNLVKALEYAMTGGIDLKTGDQIGLEASPSFNSFEELFEEVLRQLEHLCSCSMRSSDIFEKNYRLMHSSPILSSTYTSALEKGGDLYCDYTAKYQNSSINCIGLATLVDSLVAVKKLVFDDKALTLSRFVEILRSDWEGEEHLRLFIKHRFPKFGMGDSETDAIAQKVIKALKRFITGKPNVKGGIWKFGVISINWRWELGSKTAASPDGRKCGETLSQNSSASFGSDRNGATSHLLSIASLDGTAAPGGIIADIDLHSSAVSGENGMTAMLSTLKTYFDMGGFGVHYNVLDTEVLKKARLDPDAYPNLQVRLCGWNVLFNTLSDKEKDEFIARSEK